MSSTYIHLFPKNPLLPLPDRDAVIEGLKQAGFLAPETIAHTHAVTGEASVFWRPGPDYMKYLDLDAGYGDVNQAIAGEIITYDQKDELGVQANPSGEFFICNPVTSSIMDEEDWPDELGQFMDDHTHQWIDPSDQKGYYFYELECADIGISKYFITLEEGIGDPNDKLMGLLETLTGQPHRWIRTRI